MTAEPSDPDVRRVRSAVQRWAAACDRPLPWRGERDPYRVLVSEVMLQQTQARRVAPAYVGFLERFPDVRALAAADPAEVLRAWTGLGYNRRALNLWRAANEITRRGGFPATRAELATLPGVGPYTARAVAAFAFGADEAVVDANVRRILTRFLGLPARADVQPLADRLLPRGRAATWNQALMDLGATVCVARAPDCPACPLERMCAWAAGRRHTPVVRSTERFEDTRRYARGRILAMLVADADGMATAELARRCGLDAGRARDALMTLERDQLVSRAGRRWVLGTGGPQPTVPASAERSRTR